MGIFACENFNHEFHEFHEKNMIQFHSCQFEKFVVYFFSPDDSQICVFGVWGRGDEVMIGRRFF